MGFSHLGVGALMIPHLGGDMTYLQQIRALSPIAYWPMSESEGVTALDKSDNGRIGTYSNVILGQSGIGDGLTCPLFTSSYLDVYSTSLRDAFNGSAGTISLWAYATDWNGNEGWPFCFLPDGNNWIIFKAAGDSTLLLRYKAGGTEQLFSNLLPVNAWNNLALTWTKADDKICAYLNGAQPVTPQTGLGVWAGTLGASQTVIGSDNKTPSIPFAGKLAHAAIWDRALSATQILTLARKSRVVYFDGDSRTYGTGGTSPYPTVTMASFPSYAWYNFGVIGQTVDAMNGDAVTQIDSRVATGKSTIVVWGGVNDAAGGANAATIYSRLETYCSGRKAAGYKVVICTEIDAQDASRNAVDWHGTIYPTLNASLRVGYTNFANVLVDLGNDARLQDATNTTYFDASDKVHLTDAGYAVVATLVGAAL